MAPDLPWAEGAGLPARWGAVAALDLGRAEDAVQVARSPAGWGETDRMGRVWAPQDRAAVECVAAEALHPASENGRPWLRAHSSLDPSSVGVQVTFQPILTSRRLRAARRANAVGSDHSAAPRVGHTPLVRHGLGSVSR